jgi:hypothetical protein
LSIAGQVVGGGIGDILVRQQSGSRLEVGDLLVSEEENSTLILQVFGLQYGSQIDGRVQEMMSGVILEEGPPDAEFYEPNFVNYVMARVKALARVNRDLSVNLPKSLPAFFGKLRIISSEDLRFLQGGGRDRIFIGHIRSGSKVIQDAEVWLDARDIFTHHLLIPATTGRGKSNLVKCVLYHLLDTSGVGALVLDAHNEYYGLGGEAGLSSHPNARNSLVYYTPTNPPPGARHLTISLDTIRLDHFEGIVEFSDAQVRTMRKYYSDYRGEWISQIMLTDFVLGEAENRRDAETKAITMAVLRQKIRQALDLEVDREQNMVVSRHSVFDSTRGGRTADEVVQNIEEGRVVVLDTSKLNDEAELVVGSIIATRILDHYREAKTRGALRDKPVATIVIEEAPRVIGEDVLKSRTSNIYSTIAREGRKFKVGLTAVTQLSSVIPKAILANMNTKIILGNEMKVERMALIESASQDLSEDDRAIASLDKGEAIITSIFVPFALPIQIPHFEEIVRQRPPPASETARVKVF